MSGSDDRWYQVFDIITGIDEDITDVKNLLRTQNQILATAFGVDTGGGGDGSDSTERSYNFASGLEIQSSPIDRTDFNHRTKDTLTTISPGATADVLKVDLDEAALWHETGTHDRTYSEYAYYIDGEQLFRDGLNEPLGLYNDTYQFPQPIIAEDSINIKVTRDTNAGSSEDYSSKIRFVAISNDTAQDLKEAWKSV